MKTIQNDWKPEVRSLLRTMTTAGLTLDHCDNGENKTSFANVNLAGFVDELIACDECSLFVRNPDGKRLWVYLVFGNSPGELVADYTCDPILDSVTTAHYDAWENRKQPTQEIERNY